MIILWFVFYQNLKQGQGLSTWLNFVVGWSLMVELMSFYSIIVTSSNFKLSKPIIMNHSIIYPIKNSIDIAIILDSLINFVLFCDNKNENW